MRVQNSYDLDIFIDDLNVFSAPGTLFVSADIIESIEDPIPSCTLTMLVPLGWINDRAIVDGTKIRFDIKSKEYDISESLCFRLFDIVQLSLEQKFCKIQLNGVLDFHPGYRFYNRFNMYGASSDVFKAVATHFGLSNNIDTTNDVQLWASGEMNLYCHLNNIAKFGWIDETSGMFWCIDRHKTLLYKNLTSLFRTRNQKCWSFVQASDSYSFQDKRYGYSTATMAIKSGTENILHEGYGGDDKYFDTTSYQWKFPTAKKVVAESSLINISKELSNGLNTNWYPFDTGNFHKNYWLARKQNARVLSTYSTYAILQSSRLMNYRLGQIVKFALMDSQSADNTVKMGTGVYIINSISIHLTKHVITSVVKLAMQGLNAAALTRETY